MYMFSKTFLSVMLLVTFICSRPAMLYAQEGSPSYKDMATEILKYVNEHRTGMGLKPLKVNPVITDAAQRHTDNMASGKVPFSHDGFEERTGKIAKQLHNCNSFAENVGTGRLNARKAVDMWLKSD